MPRLARAAEVGEIDADPQGAADFQLLANQQSFAQIGSVSEAAIASGLAARTR